MTTAVEATTTRSRRLTYLPALDGIRALSVLSVIGFHFGLFFAYRPGDPAVLHHVGSFVLGVQMFFVLSGALITSLLVSEHQRTDTVSLSAFYLRRTRRLGPALVVLVPLMIIGQLAWNGVGVFSPLGRHAWLAVITVALFVGNWVLFNHDGDLGWLGPAWSLAVEEQYYLTWPIVLRACLRREVRRITILVGLVVALIVSVGISTLLFRHRGQGPTYYATPTQLPCILLGSALGYEITVNPGGPLTRLLRLPVIGVIGGVGVVAWGYELGRHATYLYQGGYVPFAVFGCLLVGHCFVATDRHSVVTRLLAWRPLVAVGKVSYEAYLIHVIVILTVIRVFPHLHVWPMLLLDSVLIGLASAALYLLFDQPIRRYGWRAFFARSRATVDSTGDLAARPPT